jgi:hypothetical protein
VTPNHPLPLLPSPNPDASDLATPDLATPDLSDADLPKQHAAIDADIDTIQRRLGAVLDQLRDHPEADEAALASLPALLAERQRLLTQQAALWMRWRARGGQLLWVPPHTQPPPAAASTKHAPPPDPGAQRVPIRVLHKPAPPSAAPPPTTPSLDAPPKGTPTAAPSHHSPSSAHTDSAHTDSAHTDSAFTVTDDLRASLQDAFANTLDTRQRVPSAAHDLDILQALLRLAGAPVFLSFDPPQPADLPSRLREEVATLQRVSEPHPLASLQRLSRAMQAHFLGMIIARLRNLQDLPGNHHPTVSGIFPHLETFSRLHQPGPINGFSRKHTPLRGSWLKDARFHHQRLFDLLNPPPDIPDNPEHLLTDISTLLANLPSTTASPTAEIALDSEAADSAAGVSEAAATTPVGMLNALCKRFIHIASDNDPRLLRLLHDHTDLLTGKTRKRIKKSIDRAQHLFNTAAVATASATPADPDPALTTPAAEATAHAPDLSDQTPQPPTDDLDAPDFLVRWPWRAQTEGKRAVIVGGEDQREDIRARAAAAFAFASLEWHPANQPKRLETLAKRVKQGSLDLVILLKRFISHRVEDILVKPCKKHGVRYLYLEQGYSPDQLRRAIERHLPHAEGSLKEPPR